MTKSEFMYAMKALADKGFESVGSVMCTTPEMCGVHYYNPATKEKFLLNKFTFKEVK